MTRRVWLRGPVGQVVCTTVCRDRFNAKARGRKVAEEDKTKTQMKMYPVPTDGAVERFGEEFPRVNKEGRKVL